jgi:hypothetical protein
MPDRGDQGALPNIPVIDVGADFPMATLLADEARAHKLIDEATRGVPRAVLGGLDAVSRRWLRKWDNAHLPEIEAIAHRLGRPGAYFLSVNYEWGCTVAVGPSPDRGSARLARTLDWVTHGLGRNVIAARVACDLGPFVTLTWPGFTGVIQGLAPGRFAAALNQAPMRKLGGGFYPTDWMANRARVWRMPHPTPLHVLRSVFETARDFATAKAMLTEQKIAAPAIFSITGIGPGESCVIERTEEGAHVIEGSAWAVNHWQQLDVSARPRGVDSRGRLATMSSASVIEFDAQFPWLVAPVLNSLTRLAMVADASAGRLMVQGYEDGKAATAVLDLST